MLLTEANIKRQICDYLATRQAQIGPYLMFWLNETVGIRGRKRSGKYQKNGLPDIFIVAWGDFLSLEVKKPGEGPSDDQKKRAVELEHAGARTAVVHSLEEAIFYIEKWLA